MSEYFLAKDFLTEPISKEKFIAILREQLPLIVDNIIRFSEFTNGVVSVKEGTLIYRGKNEN